MSTASNHMKRSHRSQHKSACYTGSRMSVIKPTVSKHKAMQLMSKIRNLLSMLTRLHSKESAVNANVASEASV